MRRLYFIDNLRVACMLLGLFVHVSTLADFGVLNEVATLSAMLRMATFFTVSGYLAVMLLRRRGTGAFLRNRMRSLAIPLASSLVLLNPLTLWLIFRWHNGEIWPDAGMGTIFDAVSGRIDAAGTMSWHLHLWFLFSLIFYILTLPLLIRGLDRLGPAITRSWPATWRGGVLLPLTAGLAVTFLVLLLLTVLKLAGPAVSEIWLVRATAQYWPFFLLGALMFGNDRLRARLQRIDIPLLLIAVAATIAQYAVVWPETVAGLLMQNCRALWRLWITFALLAVFCRWFDRTGPFAALLSRSIYTVYLFHYLLIYALAPVWAQWFAMDGFAFFGIAFVAGVLAIGLHTVVIENIPLLSFLFNGKGQAGMARLKSV